MKKTPKIYGALPQCLGKVCLKPEEMLFWLYFPIKIPGQSYTTVAPNLQTFYPLVDKVQEDLGLQVWTDKYVYITAKTLYVTPQSPGNRSGWHSDGFLTEDLNYIWCDANPTVFFFNGNLHSFSEHHTKSLEEMDSLCEPDKGNHFEGETHTLYKLNQTMLHKVNTDIAAGVRTFVKISVSDHLYSLKGNSRNYSLDFPAPDTERKIERNCPTGM